MNYLHRLLMTLSLLFLFTGPAVGADEFPNRALFPKVPVVEHDDLYNRRQAFIIIDVRSAYEYETLHINGARNIPLDDAGFTDALAKLRASDNRPMAFYCNGHACKKSYEAAQKAHEAGIADVFCFDAGIFVWSKAHPGDATLLGKSPVDPAKLITPEKFKAHLLEPAAFAEKVPSGVVIDIRDMSQRVDSLALFPTRQRNVNLDNAQLKSYVDQARKENKPLLVYDAVGKQVEWLQYFLEAEGLSSYYFLKGGAKAYYEKMVK